MQHHRVIRFVSRHVWCILPCGFLGLCSHRFVHMCANVFFSFLLVWSIVTSKSLFSILVKTLCFVPGLSTFNGHSFPSFWICDLIWIFKTYKDSQVSVGVRVAVSLFQSNCGLFNVTFTIFSRLRLKVDG